MMIGTVVHANSIGLLPVDLRRLAAIVAQPRTKANHAVGEQ